MTAYESVIILDPTLDDEQAQAIFDDIHQRFTEGVGVEILVADHWGRRKLAYEIERKTEGNYMFYRFHRDNLTSSADFTDLERHLRFKEGVMRFMITRITDEEAKAPVLRPEIFSYSARPSRGPGRPDRFGGAEGRGERRPEGEEAKPGDEAEAPAGEGDAAAEATAATPPVVEGAEPQPAEPQPAEPVAEPVAEAEAPVAEAAAEDDAKE